MDQDACPLCNHRFPIAHLPEHASGCNGVYEPPLSSAPHSSQGEHSAAPGSDEEDESHSPVPAKKPAAPPSVPAALTSDEEFARALAAEEEKALAPAKSSFGCQICQSAVPLDQLYILDECSHKFCQGCIKKYVTERISVDVTLKCPVAGCGKELSVRDTKELLPKVQHSGKSSPAGIGPAGASAKATERIMQEYKHITKSNPEKSGYSVAMLDDNLYHWEVRFFDFDTKDASSSGLAADLAKTKEKCILLHLVFPKNFPFSPPFIRVIRPRFKYRTGHVTIGGSICTEMLTQKGWSPANTIESVLVSIRTNLTSASPPAALDFANRSDYSEAEARDAFNRMVAQHGW